MAFLWLEARPQGSVTDISRAEMKREHALWVQRPEGHHHSLPMGSFLKLYKKIFSFLNVSDILYLYLFIGACETLLHG